jgi:hypothetical protein
MKKLMGLLIAGLIFNSGATAQFMTGNTLLEACDSQHQADRNVCVGYLMAVADTTGTYQNWGLVSEGAFCIRGGITSGQLARVAVKGLSAKPEELDYEASGLVLKIFQEAFPCDSSAD